MEIKIAEIKKKALEQIKNSKNFKELTELKIKYLGKKSDLVLMLKQIGNLAEKKKKEFGKTVNLTHPSATALS